MEFNKELQDKSEEINRIIEDFLPKAEGFQKTVLDAMNYSFLAGGKRLRPMLINESYRLFGGEGDKAHPYMAAMEMIHTYSLVHDDLPAMDNDEFRRGMKSTHAKYGEAMGILCGDALLNYAFEVMSGDLALNTEKSRAKALSVLAKKAGIYGMIGGQVADVENEGKPIDEETLLFIHMNKTAALIEASLMIGAILAGASEEEIDLMESIGSDVGMAFQIQDDILDVTSTTEVLGKPVGSDEKNEKTTFVTLFGLEEAKKRVEDLSKRAVESLDALKGENEFLRNLIIYLISRDR